MAAVKKDEGLHVRVENVGGIVETDLALSPGVTVLSGQNATNRTSFLRAVMGAMGSDEVSLKGDAQRGRIELSIAGETCVRELSEAGDTTGTTGDVYLDPADVELGELFAFLLRGNEARQAITRGGDLREVIMRPVDTEAIEAEIERLEEEKRRLSEDLDRLDGLEADLTRLEETRAGLRSELEDIEERIEERRATLEQGEGSAEESREHQNELESVLADLQEAQSELEETEFRLETEQESLAGLEEELAEIEAEREGHSDSAPMDVAEIEAEIDRLREHKQSLESTVTQLQRVIGFNEGMLSGEHADVRHALGGDSGDDAVTDQLVADGAVCWTCGRDVDTGTIRETLTRLRELREEKAAERRDIEAELDELTERKRRHERERRERERLESRHETVTAEIEDREDAIDDLERRRETLSERIEELNDRVEALERQERSEAVEIHTEINRLEIERDRKRTELDELDEEIEEVETELDHREGVVDELETCTERLTELRTRIERLETEAIEAFNEHMETVLDILEYDNLARIWIERTRETVREGRRRKTNPSFDLHIVRSTDDGTTYEDCLEHLSESEREVTGLVFALAGYLVHNVHERVPVMLLDSLEAIDSERIADLVGYFEAFPEHLVVALLPEDARALEKEYDYVEQI
ncbi:MAG: archaea-specific SMC-related protein [Halobacteriales archaeon]